MYSVYDSVIAGPLRDFSKSILPVICCSSINYAVCSPIILLSSKPNFYQDHFGLYLISWFLILVIVPIILVSIYLWLALNERIANNFFHPIHYAWDWFFRKGDQEYWVIVHLKDGSKVGGKYGRKSFASSSPASPQIFLEKAWRLDDKGRFVSAIEGSAGILFTGEQLVAIEFFSN